LARILALVAACIGLLTLSEYVFGWDLGIDQLLFTDSAPEQRYAPGRMAPMTALSFLLFGAAAPLSDDSRGWRGADKVAAFVALAGLIATVGYAYDAQALYGMAPSGIMAIHMALHTAALLLVLGVGAMAAQPDVGLMALLLSDGPGGSTLRR